MYIYIYIYIYTNDLSIHWPGQKGCLKGDPSCPCLVFVPPN